MKPGTFNLKFCGPVIILASCFFANCGMSGKIGEMLRMANDVRREFDHESINFSYVEGKENYWTVTFLSFDIKEHGHSEMETLAGKVKDFLLESYEKAAQQDYFRVVFTPEASFDDEPIEKVSFQFDN